MRNKGLPGMPPGFPPPPGIDLSAAGLPFFPAGLAGSLFQRTGAGSVPQQSELQRAMDIYHQEFSRLQQNALAAALKAQNGTSKGADLPCGSPGSIADNDKDGSPDGGKHTPEKASPIDLGKIIFQQVKKYVL